jgi:NAD(P)-dependent dehydrogenase (short-subunit alcohol dehydrogenase family)
MHLEDRTVIVSGVGIGLGKEIATAILAQGGKVVLAARTTATLESIGNELDPTNERVAWLRTDITSAADCDALVAFAEERFGGVDGVAHCAALDNTFGGIEDADFEVWRQVFDVNVFGTMQLTKAAVPALKKTKGSVVFVGTQAAFKSQVLQMAYGSSKAALQGAAVHMAVELGAFGIRVNTVVPSWIWGPVVEGYMNHQAKQRGVDLDTVVGEVTTNMAIKQIPTSRDIADAVAFFLSDEARRITGQQLLVNAGEYLR